MSTLKIGAIALCKAGVIRTSMWTGSIYAVTGAESLKMYDNAIMESFYQTLKRELVQDAHYDNPEQARMDIFKYIELYYNTKRIHST